MDLYKVTFQEDSEGDLYGISLTDNPANSYEFLALSEDFTQIEMKAVDKEKKTLTGVVLVPNQKIKRLTKDKGLFEVFFEEETIEKVSQNFFKKGYQRNSTYNHLEDLWLKGTTVVESWLVQDSNNDKANALGFKSLPKGTWMITMKLSDELWDEYIKTGKAKGFSIDAYMQLEKVELSNLKLKKEKMSVLKELINLFSKSEDIKLSSINIEGLGDLTADAFDEGNVVYLDIDGDMQELKSVAFTYDGFNFLTDDKGEIIEKVAVVEETPADEVEEAPTGTTETVEDTVKEVTETEDSSELDNLKAELEALNLELATVKEERDSLQAELDSLKTENVEMNKQVLELSALPKEGKLKSMEIKMSSERATETTLEAIKRITKQKQ